MSSNRRSSSRLHQQPSFNANLNKFSIVNAPSINFQQMPQSQVYPPPPQSSIQQIPMGGSPSPMPNNGLPMAFPIVTPLNNPQTYQPTSTNPQQAMPNGYQMGSGYTGVTLIERIKLSLKSQIEIENDWSISTLLQLSSNAANSSVISNPDDYDTILNHLLDDLMDVSKRPVSRNRNKTYELFLQKLLIIRNMLLINVQLTATATGKTSSLLFTLLPIHVEDYEITKLLLEVLEILSNKQNIVTTRHTQDFTNIILDRLLPEHVDDSYLLLIMVRVLTNFYIVNNDLKVEYSKINSFIYLLSDPTQKGTNELLLTVLNFFYQYTLHGDFSNIDDSFVYQSLVRLCNNNINVSEPKYLTLPVLSVPQNPPELPSDLYAKLYALPEPLRATLWLRICYESSTTNEVTQISLWKSYEKQFGNSKLLPAVEFIKNVNFAIKHSSAMVLDDVNPMTGETTKKFVIKGIKPRWVHASENFILPEGVTIPGIAPEPKPAAANTGTIITAGGTEISDDMVDYSITAFLVLKNLINKRKELSGKKGSVYSEYELLEIALNNKTPGLLNSLVELQ